MRQGGSNAVLGLLILGMVIGAFLPEVGFAVWVVMLVVWAIGR